MIKYQWLQDLLKDGDKFTSLTARLPCMMTVTETNNDLELLELIGIMHQLTIPKKYLFAKLIIFNGTVFSKLSINFNVMIHHRYKGMLMLVITCI